MDVFVCACMVTRKVSSESDVVVVNVYTMFGDCVDGGMDICMLLRVVWM